MKGAIASLFILSLILLGCASSNNTAITHTYPNSAVKAEPVCDPGFKCVDSNEFYLTESCVKEQQNHCDYGCDGSRCKDEVEQQADTQEDVHLSSDEYLFSEQEERTIVLGGQAFYVKVLVIEPSDNSAKVKVNDKTTFSLKKGFQVLVPLDGSDSEGVILRIHQIITEPSKKIILSLELE